MTNVFTYLGIPKNDRLDQSFPIMCELFKRRIHRIMKKLDIHAVIRKKRKNTRLLKPEETAENKLAETSIQLLQTKNG